MKICTIVVTYNRKKLLAECLQALLNQTRKLDKIFVIDNASADGTNQTMKKNFPQITYVKLLENLGGAGGFYTGVKIAYNKGYDWLWLMDDDAEPCNDALEKLLNSNIINDPKTGALMSLIVNEKNQPEDRSLESIVRVEKTFKKIKLNKNVFYAKEKTIKVSSYPLLGVLISKNAVKKIGFPNPDFFIQCDDLDYTLRISDLFNMYIITKSKIKHKNQQPVTRSLKTFISERKLRRLPLEQLWKDYYGIRNYIFILMNRLGILHFLIYFIKFIIPHKILSLVFNDNKMTRLVVYKNAVFDGLNGNLGKIYSPDSFKKQKKYIIKKIFGKYENFISK